MKLRIDTKRGKSRNLHEKSRIADILFRSRKGQSECRIDRGWGNRILKCRNVNTLGIKAAVMTVDFARCALSALLPIAAA